MLVFGGQSIARPATAGAQRAAHLILPGNPDRSPTLRL